MPSLRKYLRVHPAKSWSDIESWIKSQGDKSLFRGQADSGWSLETHFERALKEAGVNLSKAGKLEKGMIRRFQRESHQYLPHIPDSGNIPEWLALMQHHGAPTRLQDWTHSAFVALFFASIDLKPTGTAAIYSLKWDWIDKQVSAKAKALYNADRNLSKKGMFTKFCGSTRGIAKLNSFRLTVRQSNQQGTFLIPTNLRKSFEDNLIISLSAKPASYLSKLEISWSLRKTIIQELYRRNITAGSLFPGLDGYARSFRSLLAVENILDQPRII